MDQHQGRGRGGEWRKRLEKEKKNKDRKGEDCMWWSDVPIFSKNFVSFWLRQYRIIPDAKAWAAEARHYYTVPFPTVTI